MVGEVEVSRVGIRDGLSVDLTVQMEDPRDYDFRPSLHFEHTTLTVKLSLIHISEPTRPY